VCHSLDAVDVRKAFDELDRVIREGVCPGLEIVSSAHASPMEQSARRA
jgi:hypothetical protein